jgi:hypothetical protein
MEAQRLRFQVVLTRGQPVDREMPFVVRPRLAADTAEVARDTHSGARDRLALGIGDRALQAAGCPVRRRIAGTRRREKGEVQG